MNKQEDRYKRWKEVEKIGLQRNRALDNRVRRAVILGAYGLSDPKELPEECKHCNNFYCTFCFKCRHLTKRDSDPDYQASTEEVTENFRDYENMCKAIVAEHYL